MPYNDEELTLIFYWADGLCFYCEKKLSFSNYGKVGERGAWEVDHFIPIASNGAHQMYNLVPACVSCNTEKSDMMPWEYQPLRFKQGDRDPNNYL